MTSGLIWIWTEAQKVEDGSPVYRVLEQSSSGLYQFGVHYTLRCLATGYPAPSVSWTFKPCTDYKVCKGKPENLDSTKDTKG